MCKPLKKTVNCLECGTVFQVREFQVGQGKGNSQADFLHGAWTKLCPACAGRRTKEDVAADAGKDFTSTVVARWAILKKTPEKLNQDAFGVCGYASCLYVLLKNTDQTKAQELFEATFAQGIPAYNKATYSPPGGSPQDINFLYLTRKYFASGRGFATTAFFTDYMVCRALGYLLKRTANARYQADKTEFNKEWGWPTGVGQADYHAVTRAGSLAARTNNVAYVLKNLLGANDVCVWSKEGATQDSLAQGVNGVANKVFKEPGEFLKVVSDARAQKNSFAVLGVLNWSGPNKEFLKTTNEEVHAASQGRTGKTGAAMKYTHWVVLDNATLEPAPPKNPKPVCESEHVTLSIWTWADTYTVKVCKQHLLSYVQDVIVGHF
jgi:hypothetical protein